MPNNLFAKSVMPEDSRLERAQRRAQIVVRGRLVSDVNYVPLAGQGLRLMWI